jgi:hypothetical protein
MGRLERHLDPEAVRRVLAGIRYKDEPIRKASDPRKAETYRGYRRNQMKKRR